MTFNYTAGFDNEFESEAREGALPRNQNNPQSLKYDLFAEQISGTAFTAKRNLNKRSWLYRKKPLVTKEDFKLYKHKGNLVGTFIDDSSCFITPNPLRWSPFALENFVSDKTLEFDFVDGLHTICGAGDPSTKDGLAIHVYLANKSMSKRAFYNSDGDFLIVPEQGGLVVQTEFGYLEVDPGEIIVIPKGITYRVQLKPTEEKVVSRGYVLEIYGGHFELPELGPIGANGLANKRDFKYPVAAYDDSNTVSYEILNKFLGRLYFSSMTRSPFDVLAWHGNYLPYKYNLENFQNINSVSFDHPDPSIFTVLTCPKDRHDGVALADFVLFTERFSVAENTFRPPYFHRNCMSEFMGLIKGQYEAKEEGFSKGGASLHNTMTPHGPDKQSFHKASTEELKPTKVMKDTMAFMFESCYTLKTTKWAMNISNSIQKEYSQVWKSL